MHFMHCNLPYLWIERWLFFFSLSIWWPSISHIYWCLDFKKSHIYRMWSKTVPICRFCNKYLDISAAWYSRLNYSYDVSHCLGLQTNAKWMNKDQCLSTDEYLICQRQKKKSQHQMKERNRRYHYQGASQYKDAQIFGELFNCLK